MMIWIVLLGFVAVAYILEDIARAVREGSAPVIEIARHAEKLTEYTKELRDDRLESKGRRELRREMKFFQPSEPDCAKGGTHDWEPLDDDEYKKGGCEYFQRCAKCGGLQPNPLRWTALEWSVRWAKEART